jgi:hypothetical protein
VLKINFQPYGKGAKKIERGEFTIRDRGTKKAIDLSVDWNTCFTPGQKVDMCMLFKGFRTVGKKECPFCHRTLPTGVLPTRSKLKWWVRLNVTEELTLTYVTGKSGCGITYQQVIPFRSIFDKEGRLRSSVFKTAQDKSSPESLFKPLPSADHQTDVGSVTLQPERSPEEIIDDTQYVEVVELWHHAPDVLPRNFTIENERDDTSCQGDTETSGIKEEEKDKIGAASTLHETTPSPSAYPEAEERKDHKELDSYTQWWVCCRHGCGREINSALWGETCPDCSHRRCMFCEPTSTPFWRRLTKSFPEPSSSKTH